jgi:putative protein-disulfide isomerase
MCSWCYAFAPTWNKLLKQLDNSLHVKYIYGGLAPHSNEPMPQSMQEMLQNTWKDIEQRVGTQFNYDFWSICKPRRSTYLSCQAGISAKLQSKEYEMIQEIQKAYYQNASNPSDRNTLELVASNINLNVDKFSHDLESDEIINLLKQDLHKRRELGVNGFPSLVLQIEDTYFKIPIAYKNHEAILKQITSYM